jgi:hypothetical protein
VKGFGVLMLRAAVTTSSVRGAGDRVRGR